MLKRALTYISVCFTGDIEYYKCCYRILKITWDEAAETLLSCCVPKLQPDGFAPGGYTPREEIDPDGGLALDRSYVMRFVEFIFYVSVDDRAFAHGLISQHHHFALVHCLGLGRLFFRSIALCHNLTIALTKHLRNPQLMYKYPKTITFQSNRHPPLPTMLAPLNSNARKAVMFRNLLTVLTLPMQLGSVFVLFGCFDFLLTPRTYGCFVPGCVDD